MKKNILLVFAILFSIKLNAQLFNLSSGSSMTVNACNDNNAYQYTFTPVSGPIPASFDLLVDFSFHLNGSTNSWTQFSCNSCTSGAPFPILISDLNSQNAASALISMNGNIATIHISNYNNATLNLILNFKLKLDCSVANNGNSNTVTLNEIWSSAGIQINSSVMTKQVNYPLLSAVTPSPVTFTLGYLNELYLTFQYHISNPASAPLLLDFLNNDLAGCLSGYTVSTYYKFASDLNDSIEYTTPFITNASNDDIIISQVVHGVTACVANCTNKNATLNWKCNYGSNFCNSCLINNVSPNLCSINYSLANQNMGLEIKRILPAIVPFPGHDDFRFDNSCPGDLKNWSYQVKNTGPYIIPLAEVFLIDEVIQNPLLDNVSVTPQLRLIPESSISYNIVPACIGNTCGCTASIQHHDNTFIYNPGTNYQSRDVTYNLAPSCNVTNPINGYRIFVTDLCPGDIINFSFSIYSCCTQDEDMYDYYNSFNNWGLHAMGKTECDPNQPDITDNSSYSIMGMPQTSEDLYVYNGSRYINQSGTNRTDLAQQCELPLVFTPATSDMTGPGDGSIGPADNFFVETKGFNSAGIVGISENNSVMKGVLRVKIHCNQGLVVNDLFASTSLTSPDGISLIIPKLGCFTDNTTPDCHAADYYVYFNLSEPNMQAVLMDGHFNFQLSPCCSGSSLSVNYSISFDILGNVDLFSSNGGCQFLNYQLPGNNCLQNELCPSCCWLPISRARDLINVHCPGCMAPGIIIDSYSLDRKSMGLEDADNDGLADNSNTITPNYSKYEFINKKYSNFGDLIEDKMDAHFIDGALPPGYMYNQMVSGGGLLDNLQVARSLVNGNLMDVNPVSLTLYIDLPGSGNLPCLDCDEFNLDPLSRQTIAKVNVSGLPLSSYFTSLSSNDDRTYLFSFDISNINAYNDITLPYFNSFETGQQYRLVVDYEVCGNFTAYSYFTSSLDDVRKKSRITNFMWLTGEAKFITNWTQFAAMPNDVNAMIANGDVDVNGDPLFDETFANKYIFWCEAYNGIHYFISTNYTSFLEETETPGNQCKRRLSVSPITRIGSYNVVNLFPFEFKPPSLFIDGMTFTVPPGWKITSVESRSAYWPYVFSLPVVIPGFSLPLLAGTSLTVTNSQLPLQNCLNENVNLGTPTTTQYSTDDYNNQLIDMFMEPDNADQCDPGLFFDLYQPGISVSLASAANNCSSFSSSTCSLTSTIYPYDAHEGPFYDLHEPNPNIVFQSNGSNVTQALTQACYSFNISNPQNQSLNATGIQNVFAAIPISAGLIWNQFTDLTNQAATPFISNGYVIFPLGNIDVVGPSVYALNLCASLQSCPLNASFPLYIGWDCQALTTNLNPQDACYFVQKDILSLSTPGLSFSLNTNNPLPDYSLCQPFAFDLVLLSDNGPIISDTIKFTQLQDFTIQSCEIIDCQTQTPVSPSLTQIPGTNSFLIPPVSLSNHDELCIRVWLLGTCNYSGMTPDVTVVGSTFCGTRWSRSVASVQLNLSDNDSCPACNNCSNLTLTYEVSHCYVTFTAGGSPNPACDSTTYFWNFGDGDTLSSTDNEVSHEYGFNGNYTVSYVQYCFDSLGVLIDSCVVDTTIAVQCEGCNGLYMETVINGCEVSMQGFAPNLVGCDFVMYAWGYGDGTYTPSYSLSNTSTHTYPQSDTTYLLCFGAFCYSDGQLVNECKLCNEIQVSCNNNSCEGLKINVDNIKNCSVTFSAVLPQGLNCSNPVFVWYFEGNPVTGSQVQNHVFSGAGAYTVYCEVYCNGAVPGVDPPTCKGNMDVKTENCTCDDFKITSEIQNCSVTFHALVPSNYSCSNPVYVWYFDNEPPVTGSQTQAHEFTGSGYHTIWCEVFCNGTITGAPDCKVADYIILEDCHIAGCRLLEDGLNTSEKTNAGRDILKTSDNGYIIVGELNQAYSDKDLYAVKYDQYENVEFKLRYGDSGSNTYIESAYSVAETNDAFYIAGIATTSSTGYSDVVVTKVLKNPIGTISWSKRYDFGRDDVARKIIDLGSGQLLVAGYTNSGTTAPVSDYDMLAFTIDVAGNVISKNIYGNRQSSKLEFAYDAIKLSGSNQVVLAGEARVPGGKDILLVKITLNSSLSYASNKILKGNENELANSLVEYNGSLWVTGFSNSWSSSSNDTDIFVAKILPSDFSVQAFQMFGSTAYDESGNKIRKTSDGNLMIAGWRRNTNQKYDGLELKVQTSALANNYWSKRTNYSNNSNLFYSVDEFLTNRYIFTGNYVVSAQNTELLKVLTDTQAVNCCLTNYNLSTYAVTPTVGSAFTAQAIGAAVVDSSIVISQFISENVLCVSENTRTENTVTGNLNQHSGITVFPNPANNSFKIQLDNKKEVVSQILLYDISGRIIKSFLNPVRNDGLNFEVDAGSLINGIYFIEVTGDNQVWKTKVIINK